ncbi:hypothetical protein BDP67DRAFT_274305 [Colletotrichum lupini]|nr:hypothetical protein BDP67DRAFT_274305 [Colletotrichum lupini]
MVRRLHTGLEERSQVEACEGGGVRDRWAKPSGEEEAKKSRTRERVFIKIWIRQRGWYFAAHDWFCSLGLSRSLVASSPCICPSHVDCRRLLLMRLSNPRFFKKLPSTEATAQPLLCCFVAVADLTTCPSSMTARRDPRNILRCKPSWKARETVTGNLTPAPRPVGPVYCIQTTLLGCAAPRCDAMLCDVFAMHQGFRQNIVDASSNKTATTQETRVHLIDSGTCWCIRDTQGRNNAFRPVFVRDVSRLLNSVPIFAVSAGVFQDLACSPLHVHQAKVQVQPKNDVISQCWLMRPATH